MDICFVTAELSPLAKVGGLADVSSALPSALARAGHRLAVVVPFYQDLKIDRESVEKIPSLDRIPLELGGRRMEFNAFQAPFPGWPNGEPNHPQLILVEADELYGRPGVYGNEDDEFLRFLFLSRAAIEICQRLGFKPDIFHCNDWQTALIPLMLKTVYSWDKLFENTASVLTIHNIGHQGVFPAGILPYLNLGEDSRLIHQEDLHNGLINYLKTGIFYADAITAVSPTYARQIETDEYGMGLGECLRSRSAHLFGILNGIDDREWNPQIDPLIPYNFSAKDLTGKRKNKAELLAKMGVDSNLDAPTIGIVSRLAGQKGFELLFDSMESILAKRALRLVVLGSGEEKYVHYFTGLRRRFPDQVGFFQGFDNGLAHLVEAGSDFFLMPSQYEPCGLNQMYSQVYGTIPIVRKTGGLADTVEHFVPSTGEGTGVVFEHFTAEGVHWAINYALDIFEDRDSWDRVVQNAMARDFSWNKQAHQYEALYQRLHSPSFAQ